MAISEPVADAIARAIQGRSSGSLLADVAGRPRSPSRPDGASSRWARRSRVPRLHPRALRHAFVTLALDDERRCRTSRTGPGTPIRAPPVARPQPDEPRPPPDPPARRPAGASRGGLAPPARRRASISVVLAAASRAAHIGQRRAVGRLCVGCRQRMNSPLPLVPTHPARPAEVPAWRRNQRIANAAVSEARRHHTYLAHIMSIARYRLCPRRVLAGAKPRSNSGRATRCPADTPMFTAHRNAYLSRLFGEGLWGFDVGEVPPTRARL